MSVTFTHPLDLPQLQAELAAAGIPVPALRTVGNVVGTYDGNGQPIDLPPAAQAVVNAHVAQAPLQEAAAVADIATLKSAYQNRLTAIGQGKTLLLTGDDAGWAALTVAQRLDRLRTVLLGQLDLDADVLKALRALVR